MPQSSSNLLTITDSWIETDTAITGVQSNEINPISFWVSLSIDERLLGQGYRFDANFQIGSMSSLWLYNTWISQGNWSDAQGVEHNGYPVGVDQLFPVAGDYTIGAWGPAQHFTVYGGIANDAETNGQGFYFLRVYMFVDTSKYDGNLGQTQGTSQWAVADDVYLWCDV
jgi:hypothetical protein